MEKEKMISNEERISSIRLSTLNPVVAEKLQKFDIDNDKSIGLNEALQAIITLQKQSNNYKRIIWFMIPLFIGLIASIFGTTMLAIKLNQQTKVENGVLTTMNDNVVKVQTARFAFTYENLFDEESLAQLSMLRFVNVYAPVNFVSTTKDINDEIQSVFISTQPFSLLATRDNYNITINYPVNTTEYLQVKNGIIPPKLNTNSKVSWINGEPAEDIDFNNCMICLGGFTAGPMKGLRRNGLAG